MRGPPNHEVAIDLIAWMLFYYLTQFFQSVVSSPLLGVTRVCSVVGGQLLYKEGRVGP